MPRLRVDDATAAFRALPPEEQERVARLLAGEQAGDEARAGRQERRLLEAFRRLDDGAREKLCEFAESLAGG